MNLGDDGQRDALGRVGANRQSDRSVQPVAHGRGNLRPDLGEQALTPGSRTECSHEGGWPERQPAQVFEVGWEMVAHDDGGVELGDIDARVQLFWTAEND